MMNLTFVIVYFGLIVGVLLAYTWKEIYLKFRAMFGVKKGKGIAEIILSNGRVKEIIIDFSNDIFTYKNKKYELTKAKQDPLAYIKFKWGSVPVVTFRENIPEPLPVHPGKEISFDMEYFSKTVELAYNAGMTEGFTKEIQKIKMFMLIAAGGSVISAMVLLYILPIIQPFLPALQQAKPYAPKLAAKLIQWLK